MKLNFTKYESRFKIIAFIFLLLYVLLFFAKPITVFGADLGRILKEGELFFTEGIIIKTNFFSFTTPDYPVVNYHWLGSAFYYMVWSNSGFIGLHLFIITLQVLPISLYIYKLQRQQQHSLIWFYLTLFLCLPLISIAPQNDTFAFSIAFATLFFYLIECYLPDQLKYSYLLISLVLLQFIWVNSHIYFWLGWFLPAFALIQVFIQKNKRSKLGPLLILVLILLATSLLNPQFIQAWLVPLDILSGNFPMLSKNLQALWTASYYQNSLLFLYFNSLAIVSLTVTALFYLNRKATSLYIGLTALLFIIFGAIYVKNIAFIALAAVIVLPQIQSTKIGPAFWLNYRSPALLLYLLIPIWLSASIYNPLKVSNNFGLGHESHDFASLAFFKENNLKGNIFSNYDIAGYLIWGLAADTKIYIVNRPDAQPDEFYENAYFPKIQSNAHWHKLKDVSNLTIIYFKLKGELEDNLLFLGKRLDDGEWAMVYHKQNQEVILLRRLPEYKNIIEKFEIKTQN